jgi:hypothetical protein
MTVAKYSVHNYHTVAVFVVSKSMSYWVSQDPVLKQFSICGPLITVKPFCSVQFSSIDSVLRCFCISSHFRLQEAERPMNVHRWRQLESSNPVLYETIFRVQTLQRRLIQISEDIAQRERLTVEKEQLFKELKSVLDRQPGIEV